MLKILVVSVNCLIILRFENVFRHDSGVVIL